MPSDQVQTSRTRIFPARGEANCCRSWFLSRSCLSASTPHRHSNSCIFCYKSSLCKETHTRKVSTTARHYLNWRTPCFLQKAMLPLISNFSNLAIQQCSRISDSLVRLLEMRIPEVQLYELKIVLQHWFPSPSSLKATAKIKPNFFDTSRNKEITSLVLHWCKVVKQQAQEAPML